MRTLKCSEDRGRDFCMLCLILPTPVLRLGFITCRYSVYCYDKAEDRCPTNGHTAIPTMESIAFFRYERFATVTVYHNGTDSARYVIGLVSSTVHALARNADYFVSF